MVSRGKGELSKDEALESGSKKIKSSKNKSKSPSRTKSPSRKTKSSPSPSRKTRPRSPARKNVTRVSPVRRSTRSPARTPKRVEVKSADIDSDSDGLDYFVSVEKPKAAVRGRARRDADYIVPKSAGSSIRDSNDYVGVLRRSSQRTHLAEADRIVHLKHDAATVKKLTEFSDEDDVPIVKLGSSVQEPLRKLSVERNLATECGGSIGALLGIFALPLGLMSLFMFCNETQCSFTKLPNLDKFKNIGTYLDSTMLLIVVGYNALLTALSFLPIGGPKVSGMLNKQGKLEYLMNGLFCLFSTFGILIGLEYYKVPVVSNILAKHFQLFVSSLIVAILLSVYLYVRSFYVSISALNPYTVGSGNIYKFFFGREINPRLLNRLDVKLILFRSVVVGMILVNLIYIYKNVEVVAPIEVTLTGLRGVKYNSTLVVIAVLQIIYALDFLMYESNFVTTFEAQYEAVGYMTSVVSLTGTCAVTAISKCVLDHGIKLPNWQLFIAITLFTVGYLLFRGSNSQKHAFRRNPYSSALSHLETIQTSSGKKLLVSGYWGFVRHPNYLGDILILSAFALFIWKTPIVLICLGDIVFILARAHRDNQRCKARYGNAWDRYCQKVQYIIFPKIY